MFSDVLFCVYMSPTWYPTACSPKGYGSSLPLPSRTAAHFPAFKPESCPHLHTSYTGATLSPSPYICQRKERRKENKTQNKATKKTNQALPASYTSISSRPGSILASASASPVPSPSWAAGASSSVASLPTAISYRAPPVLPAPPGGSACWRPPMLAPRCGCRGL